MEPQPIDNHEPLKDGFNFTPLYQGERVRLRISREDRDGTCGYRGPGLKGVITDLDTGKQYKVYGRSCGLPRCMCDSEIKDYTEKPKRAARA